MPEEYTNFINQYYEMLSRRLRELYTGNNMDALEYNLKLMLRDYAKEYSNSGKALEDFPYYIACKIKDLLLEFFAEGRYSLRDKTSDAESDSTEVKQENDFLKAYDLISIAASCLINNGVNTDDYLKLCSFNISPTIKEDICKAANLNEEEYERVANRLFNFDQIRQDIKQGLIAEDKISKGGVAK